MHPSRLESILAGFERYFKHQRGQFGKWYKPSLKGYERAISLGVPLAHLGEAKSSTTRREAEAMVTSRNGYLVVTFLLPLTTEYWALCLVQGELSRVSLGRPCSCWRFEKSVAGALERASRVGSVIYFSTGINELLGFKKRADM